ncbi:hypothetical protein [Hyphomicrobium facile]|uniref:hypothetical protein n=1 Tax=Hyphomicrobium facile TaxID=51670 RepID=UPI0015A60799|nr:hypothetical protein [Hyphomicrobium facile]
MLALILPAAVIAGPLRFCVGENGHRAIEIAHANDFTHAKPAQATPAVKRSAALEDVRSTQHVTGPHCQDKLLLPVVAKSKARCVRRPSVEPVVVRDFRARFSSSTQRQAHLASRLAAVHLRKHDPRLDTLRTVVLLN